MADEWSNREAYLDHIWAPFLQMESVRERGPIVIVRGKGARVQDQEGNEYIDGHGGLWLVNIGYGREEMARAVAEQMLRLAWFGSFMGFSNEPSIRLAKKLADLARPEGMGKVFFSGSGSEAVETALKIARQYFKLTGRPQKYKVIARHRAYHGVTLGAVSVTGITANRRMFEPLLPGVRHIPAPYCYRCELGLTYPDCGIACAEELQKAIDFEGADTVAAFIAEPVQGAGGVIIPPPEYLPRVREICAKNEILFIADEVITGFGRTGTFFGCRQWNVKPDLMAMAKGITSGYIPLGATLATDALYDAFLAREPGRELRHGNTYSGHPTACAAALENIRILEAEKLPERAAELGRHLLGRLKGLERHKVVGDVAGIGLMARVEMVRDKRTRAPWGMGDRVIRKILKKGVILRNVGDVLSFSPPLVIEKEEIDRLVAAVEEAIVETMKEEGV